MAHEDDARVQVEAFIKIVHDKYGISEADIFRFVEYNRKLIDGGGRGFQIGVIAGKAAVVFLVGAFFSGVGWTVVHFIQSIVGRP